MKLYHYVTKGNDVLERGLLSFSKNPNADINYYIKRSGCDNKEDIINWMEQSFKGRSRGIRFFTEPIKWHDRSLSLKSFIENADMFSIDISALEKDGLIESIWHSPSVLDIPDLNEEIHLDEFLNNLSSLKEIDFSPISWDICDDEKGRRFAFISYYLIVIKDGIIPPKYITK